MQNLDKELLSDIGHNLGQYYSKIKTEPIFSQVPEYDLMVFSHLRWSFVTQRPQHIMSRFAGSGRKVLFVEEPANFSEEDQGTANIIKINNNISVLQPKISSENLAEGLTPLLEKYTKELNIKNPVMWFYSSAFSGILNNFSGHSLIVYDCMDELSLFKGAPVDLLIKEAVLLRKADIVFTGGKSLYEAKHNLAENVYCFPSSVDERHFQKAYSKNTKLPADIASIKRPIAGFYGVIDERMDLGLLNKISLALPDVSFVMIGPVVKISEKDLPKNPNIYYLGQKPYGLLAGYLKAMDVAIMPFALNDSTKFISPTKTLEFMAAGKPIVSTAIYDVVRDYKDVITIAQNPEEFARGVSSALAETEVQVLQRLELQMRILAKTSWDTTVSAMEEIIGQTLKARHGVGLKKGYGSSGTVLAVPYSL